MIRRLFLAVVTLVSVGLLAACGPKQPLVFGVPQSQWNALTNSEKQQVIDGYNQRRKIDAQNVPINNAIGAASDLIQQNNYYRRMQPNIQPPPPMY